MSKADELLNSLSEDDISLQLANPETEPHIIIGEDRVITVPKDLQRIAVQYDHDVETVTFDCPRYWDNLDMSKLNIYINYMRKDRYVGCYKATDIAVDGANSNIMHFNWKISRNVSEVVGELKFLVCIKKSDAEGYEVNHWNSELNTEMHISQGLEAEESIFDAHPDIISQWEDEINAVKQNISGKLDKPANDAAAKAGQLLTKTANGQEWQDREKDVFVVNMTMNDDGAISSVDKTFDEVRAACDTGKTVIADVYASQIDDHYILPSVAFKIYHAIMFAAVIGNNSMGVTMTPTDITTQDMVIQDEIIAKGILKGNGNGTISSATAGTDYVAPNGDGSNVIAEFTSASTRANITTGEKLSVLFGKIAKWFADLGSLAFKNTVAKSDLASDVQTSLGKADSALQSAPVTSVNGKTGAVKISVPTVPSATSLIKGNGSGGLVAATRGSDYIASGNIVKQTLVATETTPTENYAINWVYG